MKHREFDVKDRELWEAMPAELHRRLNTMERRLLPDHLEILIRDLCAWHPLGLHQLARLLNRSAVYIQNTCLKRMLAQSVLRFSHPEQPNHPRQAYISGAMESRRTERGAAVRKAVSAQPHPVEEEGLSIGTND